MVAPPRFGSAAQGRGRPRAGVGQSLPCLPPATDPDGLLIELREARIALVMAERHITVWRATATSDTKETPLSHRSCGTAHEALDEARQALDRVAETLRIEAKDMLAAHQSDSFRSAPQHHLQTSDDAAEVVPVLAAVWCRSVGSVWTLELHQLRRGTPQATLVDWMSSGIPISQPDPDAMAGGLLTERGLHLFRDCSAGPCTHNRRGVGYVSRDAELITLAHLVQKETLEAGRHPVILAREWVTAGFLADAAAGWIRQGVHAPHEAQQMMSRELTEEHDD